MSTRLRLGMGQPYRLSITVVASVDFDPTAPTGATFHITKPDDTTTTWTGSVTDQSEVSVTAAYSLASDGLDLDQAGTWRAWVQWTVAGQTPGPRSEVISFPVIAADQK